MVSFTSVININAHDLSGLVPQRLEAIFAVWPFWDCDWGTIETRQLVLGLLLGLFLVVLMVIWVVLLGCWWCYGWWWWWWWWFWWHYRECYQWCYCDVPGMVIVWLQVLLDMVLQIVLFLVVLQGVLVVFLVVLMVVLGVLRVVTGQCVQTDLHTKGLCLQFRQVVGVVLQLPPQVGVLLTKNLHLEGQLIIGSHSIGHLHTVQYPLQEDKWKERQTYRHQRRKPQSTQIHNPTSRILSRQFPVWSLCSLALFPLFCLFYSFCSFYSVPSVLLLWDFVDIPFVVSWYFFLIEAGLWLPVGQATARASLSRGIWKAKRQFSKKISGHFSNTRDTMAWHPNPHRLWTSTTVLRVTCWTASTISLATLIHQTTHRHRSQPLPKISQSEDPLQDQPTQGSWTRQHTWPCSEVLCRGTQGCHHWHF